MALPKVKTPTYKTKLPSNNHTVEYRPFLSGEEKIFLMALESEDNDQMIRAVRDVLHACTFEKIEPFDLPSFDVEYLFLKLREVSVGETIEMNILSKNEKDYVPVEIDLRNMNIEKSDEHEKQIQLDETVGVEMDYPTFAMVQETKDIESEVEKSEYIMKSCISKIYDSESVYDKNSFTDEELDEWLDSLGSKHRQKIKKFFDTMPTLKLEVEYYDPHTEKDEKVVFEDLEAFFT